MRRLLVLLSLVALTACRDGGDDADGPTTTTDPTTTEAATPTTVEQESALALRGDGLGIAAFGDDAEAAIDAVTSELGAPSKDTGWTDRGNEYGTCPGDSVRGIQWGEGLVLLFIDGDTAVGTGQHLSSWRLAGAPPAIATATGLGYGATAADAEDLYPGDVERVPAEDPFPSFLRIAAEGGPITAYLDDQDTITNLEGGVACGE
jgi:hypothetical protein